MPVRAQPKDSEECLDAFRQAWSLAVEKGKELKEVECVDLKETNATLPTETTRQEAALDHADELLGAESIQRTSLIADLKGANERVTAESAACEAVSTQLASALERITSIQAHHAAELA